MNREEVADWLRRYADAWESRDPDAAAALFTEDGEYHVTPFESLVGREEIRTYWKNATAGQTDIDVETEVIAVTTDLGVGRFVSDRTESGTRSITDGVCLVKLDDGTCREFREWWHNNQDTETD